MMHRQILITGIQITVWQTVRRINVSILGFSAPLRDYYQQVTLVKTCLAQNNFYINKTFII